MSEGNDGEERFTKSPDQLQSAPPPPTQTITRRYFRLRDYEADVRKMNRFNWYVVPMRQVANSDIIAVFSPRATAPIVQRPSLPSLPLAIPNALGAAPVALQRSNPSSTKLIFTLSIVSGTVILVALLAIFASRFTPASQTTLSPFDTQATISAAVASTQTALAPTSPASTGFSGVNSAQLGGPVSAFNNTFGSEASADTWNVTLQSHNILLNVDPSSDTNGNITTPDGVDRVWTLTVNYQGQTLTSAQSVAICRQFFPSDAQHVSDDTTANPVQHIYRSQELASSFDADAFQNVAGAQLSPGTFDVVYTAQTCIIETGEG